MVTVWKEGDVVRLKSGGPLMTVCSMPSIDEYTAMYSLRCIWFDLNECFDGVFGSETLVAARGRK